MRALEPDRRAWHRAQATPGPDEDVAAELERSAGRAQARGGLAAAAAFLGRAADLTVEPARRAERMLAAAQANLQAGAFDAALGLLASAQAGPLDELGRARVDLLQAEVAYAQDRGGDAPPLLLRAASSARDARRAARARHLPRRVGRSAVRRAAGERRRPAGGLPGGGDRPQSPRTLRVRAICCWTASRWCSPRGAPPRRRCCSARPPGSPAREVSVEEVLRWGWLATAAAVYLWDFDTCLAVATRGVELARDSGRSRSSP